MASDRMTMYSRLLTIYILVNLRRALGLLIRALGGVRRVVDYGKRVAERISGRIERLRNHARQVHTKLQSRTLDAIVGAPCLLDVGGELIMNAYGDFGMLSRQTELLLKRIKRGNLGAIAELAGLHIKYGDLRSALPLLEQVSGRMEELTPAQAIATASLLLQVVLVRDALRLDVVDRGNDAHRSLAEIDRIIGGLDLAGMGIALCDKVLARGEDFTARTVKVDLLFRTGKYREVSEQLAQASKAGPLASINHYLRWADSLERLGAVDEAIAVRRSGLEAFGGKCPPSELVRLGELLLRAGKPVEGAKQLCSVLRHMRYGLFT